MPRAMTTDEWVTRAKSVHGDRFDYSGVVYTRSTTKVSVICPEHGEFLIEANSHLRGSGCRKCSYASGISKTALATRWEDYKKRFSKVHGNKYDYSRAIYSKAHEPVEIVCRKHGGFMQTPVSHLSGSGCPKCSSTKSKISINEWLQRFSDTHGDRYDYTNSNISNSSTPVVIRCRTHGNFNQTPSKHASGQGCPKCVGKNKTRVDWIVKFEQAHGKRYDYSEVVDVRNGTSSICIKCRTHGDFIQTPAKHAAGQGCPKCAGRGLETDEYISRFRLVHGDTYDYGGFIFCGAQKNSTVTCREHGDWEISPNNHLSGRGCPKCSGHGLSESERIAELLKVHHGRYDYSRVRYTGSDQKIVIICPDHGEFTQTAGNHKSGQGCPQCVGSISAPENDIAAHLRGVGYEVVQSDRKIIKPKELDIVVPSKKLAIEYCGLYWHSELRGRGKKYHLEKMKLANDAGYRLITIFEDEWITRRENVLSRISHIVGVNDNTVYARQTKVRGISVSEARDFLAVNHLQGYNGCSHRYGLFYNGLLVAVMTFSSLSISKGHQSGEGKYEISRFASSVGVVGGASKLLTAFERDVRPSELLSFADRRWGDGDVYIKLGFTHSHDSDPNYWYFRETKVRKHRFGLRKNSNDNPELTEWENRKQEGWDRIWDCGNRVYVKRY